MIRPRRHGVAEGSEGDGMAENEPKKSPPQRYEVSRRENGFPAVFVKKCLLGERDSGLHVASTGERESFSARGRFRAQKKPDATPYVAMKVPPRTCSDDDRETPSKTRRHNLPVLVFRMSEQKSLFLNLAGFHCLLQK